MLLSARVEFLGILDIWDVWFSVLPIVIPVRSTISKIWSSLMEVATLEIVLKWTQYHTRVFKFLAAQRVPL